MEKIGLVLSGGMAKGAYQIGALRALEEFFKPENISVISAASIGALNGIAFSGGHLDKAEKHWRNINAEKPKIFLSTAYKESFYASALSDLKKMQLACDSFYVPLLCMRTKELTYQNIKNEEVEFRKKILSAAIAFPPFTSPVEINGHNYYDGALVDNIPVTPLVTEDVDYIICMYFDKFHYVFESDVYNKKIVKLSFDDSKTFLSESFWFTEESIDQMIRSGYEKAKSVFNFIFEQGKESESVYKQISILDSLCAKTELRVTGDVIVNNFNRLSKQFAKRTIVK